MVTPGIQNLHDVFLLYFHWTLHCCELLAVHHLGVRKKYSPWFWQTASNHLPTQLFMFVAISVQTLLYMQLKRII